MVALTVNAHIAAMMRIMTDRGGNHMTNSSQADRILVVARVLIAILCLGGALQKLFNPDDAAGLLVGVGLPAGLVYAALLYNGVAGCAILTGYRMRAAVFSFGVYCAVTSLFHWIPDDPWQMSIFVKNWAIAGGCMALGVAGSGRIALRPDPVMG